MADEEASKLVKEIKEGVWVAKGVKSNIDPEDLINPKPPEVSPEKIEEISGILNDLKAKMTQIDKIVEELKKKDRNSPTPAKTESLLKEIKVPSLEMLK